MKSRFPNNSTSIPNNKGASLPPSSRKRTWIPSSSKFKVNIEEKSFCHVAMLAKFLDLEDREILLPW